MYRISLEERINTIEHRIRQQKEEIANYIQELKELKKMKAITLPDLYGSLSLIATQQDVKLKNIEVEFLDDTREKILGGDGRSQPWSKQVGGIYCNVKTSFYLDEEQQKIVENYIRQLNDNIKVEGFLFDYL